MDIMRYIPLIPMVFSVVSILNIHLVEITTELIIGLILNITKKLIARYVIVVDVFINVVLVLNHLLHRNQTIVLMAIAVNVNIVI